MRAGSAAGIHGGVRRSRDSRAITPGTATQTPRGSRSTARAGRPACARLARRSTPSSRRGAPLHAELSVIDGHGGLRAVAEPEPTVTSLYSGSGIAARREADALQDLDAGPPIG